MAEVNQPGGTWAAPDEGEAGAAPRGRSNPAPPGAPLAGPVLPPTPLRPLTIGEIIDGAFRVLARAPRALLGVTAVFVIPVQVLSAAAQRGTLDDLEAGLSGDLTGLTGDGSGASGGETLLGLLFLLLQQVPPVFVGAAATMLVAGWYTGRDVTTSDVWRGLGRSWFALTALFLVVHVVEVAGFIACVLPGAVAVVFFSVAVPAMVSERVGPVAAIQRSFRLVGTRFWTATLLFLVSMAGYQVLSLSFSLIPSVLALLVPDSVGWIVLSVGNSAAGLVITPVVAAASVLFYFDLRFRGDGLDLELRAADVLAPGDR